MELTRPLEDNARLRAIAGPLIQSGMGETFGAGFGTDTLADLVGRDMAVSRADSAAAGRNPRRGGAGARDPRETRLSPDELNERFGSYGVRFDRAMTADAGRIIAEARQEQRIREDVIARGPAGLMGGAAVLGGSLAAMVVDPLEVVSAFIPVVGPGARAAMVARLGRVGGRTAEGVIEGAVGNALLEPIYLGLSRQQQQDYDAYDALANITLGAILGGGLGAGAGLVARRMASRTEQSRLAAVDDGVRAFDDAVRDARQAAEAGRVALAQVVQGRTVDAASVMPPMRRPKTLLETIAEGEGVADYEGDLRSMGVPDWDRSRPFRRNAMRPDGAKQDILARRLWEAGWFRDEPEAAEMLAADTGQGVEPNMGAVLQRKISEELSGEPVFRTPEERMEWRDYEQQVGTDERRRAVVDELREIGVDSPRLADVDAAIAIMERDGVPTDVAYERAAMEADRDAMSALAARENDPARDFSGDIEASRTVDPADEDLAAELDAWGEMADQMEMTEADRAFVGEADAYVAKAAAVGDTARAAALCLAG